MSDRSSNRATAARPEAGVTSTPKDRPSGRSSRGRRLWQWFVRRRVPVILGYAVLSIVGLAYLIPLLWLVITSLKVQDQVFTLPLTWIPNPIMWRNYLEALNYPGFPFPMLLRNSLYYAVFSTVGIVFSSALAAYALARIPFRGRELLFGVTIATLMIPGVVTMIPVYIIFRRLNWVGTYNPLIIPSWMGSAFFIFMLRQFMLGLPWELTDAARVDGASELRIFVSIVLPLVRPALLVVTVFNFMGCWNDFFGPVIYVNQANKMPLSLGLYAFMTRAETAWPHLMAASMIVSLPIFIIFFLAQRTFIEGIALTGLKGA
jgi:multiple sugar transport system permease protein